MNPYRYNEFKKDMKEATNQFIRNTNFKILDLGDSYIVLTNSTVSIKFCLDGVTFTCTIQNMKNDIRKDVFRLIEDGKLSAKLENPNVKNMHYREWNKFIVQKVLLILLQDLRQYID